MAVLIVEDEVLIAMALTIALSLAGYRVLGPAGSVEEALHIAAEERPELALVDLNLAGAAEGLGLARVLNERHGTTIIFLTAQPERARAAFEVAFGVISKPYNLNSVVRAVEFAAQRKAGGHGGRPPAGLDVFD